MAERTESARLRASVARAEEHDGGDSATDRKRMTKTIIAASSGNLVEWFDFYTYAFFSVYFAERFFAGTGQTGALMSTAAIFFVGFLMRPLGGYIFGRIADRQGRKKSMLIAILMMCAGSLALASLPTAATVGALAPVLLLLVRCVQGLSVGGEYGSVATYMSEIAPPGKRGFYSSFQYVTLIGGQLLASLVALIMSTVLTEDQISNGWWRLPFVLGAIAALVSLWLRNTLEETVDESSTTKNDSGSLRELLSYPRPVLVVLGITAVGSLTFYTFTTYMQKFLINTNDISKAETTRIMTACLFLFMLLQPAVGWLSDRIGRKNTMLIYIIAMVILPIPFFKILTGQQNVWIAGGLVFFVLVFVSFYTSISGILKAEMFPTHVRGLGVGFTYAVGNSLFGGSAEYAALGLKNINLAWVFPIYVSVVALIGLIAVITMRDDRIHSTIDNQ
ncbi:MFS transporter [Corynebacterium auriscanis]|uniref:MFS transporter n=1 Tax=Corynebacterium auriscanis TaxID=99807 RepID=UPI0025B3F0C1|nr:MFS transporter [Corynebacterium auriscanis]WJY73848.1 Alpha-ketoglutarate permease [Corynebacterium auriscanis]